MPISSSVNLVVLFPSKPFNKLTKALFSVSAMASQHDPTKPTSQTAPVHHQVYPKPLSPPLPANSKDVELARAMSASVRSDLFALSRDDVLYEDEWLIAINKPQGVYCESVLGSVPSVLGNSAEINGVSEGISVRKPELHLANRLDRDTSGVMVVTKLHKVASQLVKAFTDHKVKKTYIALCVGPAPKWEKITVKSGHGRSKFGAFRVYSVSDVGRSLPGGSVVKDMETSFEVLSVSGRGSVKEGSEFKNDGHVVVVQEKSLVESNLKKDEVLVRAFPRSGRTHQIRLHCQYLGISIKGDVKYEGVLEWNGKPCEGHELHAETLSFDHPITGQPLMIRAPLPLWATEALQQLEI